MYIVPAVSAARRRDPCLQLIIVIIMVIIMLFIGLLHENAVAGAGASFRYRYEFVNDGNIDKNAGASTLRTSLYYGSSLANFTDQLRFRVEAQNVAVIGRDRYNNRGAGSLWNGVDDRPAVVDPAQTTMYEGYGQLLTDDFDLKIGRQGITIGDERFVGKVPWRQTYQSFDAISVVTHSADADVVYAFLHNANVVNGSNAPMASHIFNASVAIGSWSRLAGFAYLLDYVRAEQRQLSTSTFGLAWSAKSDQYDGRIRYAYQQDAFGNATSVDAFYLLLEGTTRRTLGDRELRLSGAWERLGGGGDEGSFQTPLATLHAFNGWADRFLINPENGVSDINVSLGSDVAGSNLLLRYHDFRSTQAGIHYGGEFDWQVRINTGWRQQFAIKGAHFWGDQFDDVHKIWGWTSYSF